MDELSPASCNAVCPVDFYHPSLVGFTFGIDNWGDKGCICWYTGGTVPSIPPPKGLVYTQNSGDGNGPVVSSDFSQNYVCYAYAQVSYHISILGRNTFIAMYMCVYSLSLNFSLSCRALAPPLRPEQPIIPSLLLQREASPPPPRLWALLLGIKLEVDM